MWTTVTSFTVFLAASNSLSFPLRETRVTMPLNQAMVEMERFCGDFTKPGQMTAGSYDCKAGIPQGGGRGQKNLSLGISLESVQNPLSGHPS